MYTNRRDTQFLQRAERYPVKIILTGETFGSGQKFTVNSANISESGMLVEVADQHVPWNVGTILEITIDLSVNDLFADDMPKIKHNAKVVRQEKMETGNTTFGLQLIDLEIKERAQWVKIIRQIEQNHSKMLDK